MLTRHRLLTVLMCGTSVVLFGCSGSKPSESDGEKAVAASMSQSAANYLKLTDFKKTDGKASEENGVKQYTMMFTANLSVTKDALYNVTQQGFAGMIGPQDGDHIHAQEYKDMAREGLNAMFYASQGLRPARSGDVLHLLGSVTFEKRESGWVQTSLSYSVTQDSSARKTVAQSGSESTEAARSPNETGTPNRAANADEERLKQSLRQLVTAEERFYSKHARYSDSRTELGFSELGPVSITATKGYWTATMQTGDGARVVCGIAINHENPLATGVAEGQPKCISTSNTKTAADFDENSLEFRNYSMRFRADAAPHVGLVGGFRSDSLCIAIEPPQSYTHGGRVEQGIHVFKCAEAKDVSASFSVEPSDRLLEAAGKIRISATSSPDTIQVDAITDIRNGCSTCGFSNLLIVGGKRIRMGRAFDVFKAVNY